MVTIITIVNIATIIVIAIDTTIITSITIVISIISTPISIVAIDNSKEPHLKPGGKCLREVSFAVKNSMKKGP